MLQSHLRVCLCNILYNFSPQSRRVQNVCLVHACNLLPALHGNVEGLQRDSSYFFFVICKGVNGSHDTVNLACVAFSEIESPCQLSDNNHVEALRADDLLLHRTGGLQFIVQIGRSQVCEKVQRLPHLKETRFRPFGRLQLVPWGSCCVSADGAHENGIAGLGSCQGFIRNRNAVNINRCSAQQYLVITEFMSEALCCRIQHLNRFSNDFRTDSVTSDYADFEIHFVSSPYFPVRLFMSPPAAIISLIKSGKGRA